MHEIKSGIKSTFNYNILNKNKILFQTVSGDPLDVALFVKTSLIKFCFSSLKAVAIRTKFRVNRYFSYHKLN